MVGTIRNNHYGWLGAALDLSKFPSPFGPSWAVADTPTMCLCVFGIHASILLCVLRCLDDFGHVSG